MVVDDQIRKELFHIAREAAEGAYAPYSKFKVGAAVLTDDEKVYTGVNIENSSFGATICAERVAVTKAVSEGKMKFVAIAVFAEDAIAWPCGICRQFIYEFAPNIEVIVGKDSENLIIRNLDEILVEGFRL